MSWSNLNSEIIDLEIQVENKLAFARYRQKLFLIFEQQINC